MYCIPRAAEMLNVITNLELFCSFFRGIEYKTPLQQLETNTDAKKLYFLRYSSSFFVTGQNHQMNLSHQLKRPYPRHLV